MRIAITGAGGFLGQELLRQLLWDKSNYIFAITSQTAKLERKYAQEHQVVVCPKDILFQNANSVGHIDVLINCAYPRNINGDQLEDGLEYIISVLQSAVRLNVSAVINISSQSLYDQNRKIPATESCPVCLESIYALGKYSVELLVKVICENVPHTNIRLASLIGPGFDQRVTNKLVVKAFETGKLCIADGNQRFGFLDVEEAAKGIIGLLKIPFETWKGIYNLGSENAYSLHDIANVIADVMEKYYGKKIEIDTAVAESELNTTLDSALIMRDTGYSPRMTLEESILKIVQAYKQ
ncbi:NAD(P)-dependent oxidoreductase [Faecalicatena sp. AGMB00832]|uniref:NAD(P)-dependent oxidoreductase n=1 Tax=Faecalicatena faecalis TaxID=2726362 RepID=A0ABS6D631_9FIRM|nr:NAD(P)-dependent oxidoreductase [Faecalicatena faecalis]MBU3877057.1 NAD(P)-dependent oxidoreductase [Faecalicatena faecalis]